MTDDDLMTVAERATVEGETIHKEPIPDTPQTVFAPRQGYEGRTAEHAQR